MGLGARKSEDSGSDAGLGLVDAGSGEGCLDGDLGCFFTLPLRLGLGLGSDAGGLGLYLGSGSGCLEVYLGFLTLLRGLGFGLASEDSGSSTWYLG